MTRLKWREGVGRVRGRGGLVSTREWIDLEKGDMGLREKKEKVWKRRERERKKDGY